MWFDSVTLLSPWISPAISATSQGEMDRLFDIFFGRPTQVGGGRP
jgi:hypothetical protein